jgi:lysophospholipase L1-like esterase
MVFRRILPQSCILLAVAMLSTRAADMSLLPASDNRFLLEGRLDRSDPAQPVLIWAGTRVSLDFAGPGLALLFGAAAGQNFFDLTVDGVTEVVEAVQGRWIWPHPLGEGRHHLVLFKRSEADAGHVAFRGVELAAGAPAWAPATPAYGLRMEFIGDSITVGACNEDGATDQWDTRRTHNHALSYGHLTSLAFGADHRAVAVSGMGICEGYVPMTAGETWDRLYPRDIPARADLGAWQPDVVFVNFGENDDSFTRNNHRPFPAGFAAGYVALGRAIRAAYPRAWIVLLRGGMWGGAQSPALREAWTSAVGQLEAGDPRIAHYVFQHWSELHPRVSDHRAMAAELTNWLKKQPFMAPFLPAATP